MKVTRALWLLLLGALITTQTTRAETEVEGEEHEDDGDSSAFLLIRRQVQDELPLEGKEVKVNLEIHNAGKEAAKRVTLVEAAWPTEVCTVTGQLFTEFDSIPAGATVRHTYTVTPKQATTITLPGATVTYVTKEGISHRSTSGASTYFTSYTIVDFVKYKGLELGSTLTFGLFTTAGDWIRAGIVIGSITFIYAALTSYKGVTAATKERRRRKALAELEKER